MSPSIRRVVSRLSNCSYICVNSKTSLIGKAWCTIPCLYLVSLKILIMCKMGSFIVVNSQRRCVIAVIAVIAHFFFYSIQYQSVECKAKSQLVHVQFYESSFLVVHFYESSF